MTNDESMAEWAGVSPDANGWRQFSERLESLPPETAFVLMRITGERLPLAADPRLAIRHDNDGIGLMVAGAVLQTRATRYRGFATADQVSDSQWERYFECHEEAQMLLRAAIDLRREHGLSAAWLMAGFVDADEQDKNEAESLLKGALGVPISGFSKLLSARTEKWGGSHAAMWRAAREASQRRPPWTFALIAKAHYEHWLYLAMMDESDGAAERAQAYFRDHQTIQELTEISREIGQSETSDPYEAVYAHDVLAAVLAAAKVPTSATRHLRQVGSFGDPALLTGGPWWRRMLMRNLNGLPFW